MKLQEIWRRVFDARYSGILEAELARLRAENRALLNSILGIAGVPPITVGADAPASTPSVGMAAAKKSETPGDSSARATAKSVSVAAPTRRRSWHQVYRMLEIDSARKKEVV